MYLAPVQQKLLREAIAKLEEAYQCVQDALGETDACQFTCSDIQDVIDDIKADLLEEEPN